MLGSRELRNRSINRVERPDGRRKDSGWSQMGWMRWDEPLEVETFDDRPSSVYQSSVRTYFDEIALILLISGRDQPMDLASNPDLLLIFHRDVPF